MNHGITHTRPSRRVRLEQELSRMSALAAICTVKEIRRRRGEFVPDTDMTEAMAESYHRMREKQKLRDRKWRAKRRAAGLCPRCANPEPTGEYNYCEECRLEDKLRKRMAKRGEQA